MARTHLAIVALLCAAPVAGAQGLGDVLNLETSLGRAASCTTVGNLDVLLVANAQDNSVEVYTATRAPIFLVRVPVGQRPVDVVARATQDAGGVRRCYTANWLGDSVTSFDLIPEGGSGVRYRIGRSETVGDGPSSIAILPEIPGKGWSQPGAGSHRSLLVSLSGEGRVAWVHRDTLLPVASGFGDIELAAPDGNTAVREPRAVGFAPQTASPPNVANTFCVLNFHGGNDPTIYDLDLLTANNLIALAVNGLADRPTIGGLGSANFAMAFGGDGGLYVAGQVALNKQLQDFVEDVGEPVMRGLVTNGTGFVTTILGRVTGVGTSSPTVEVRDLNLEGGGQAAQAITQATGVVCYGDGLPGSTRIFVTGFNSDSMGVIALDATGLATSPMARVDLADPVDPFPNASFEGVMHGPRAFALKSDGVVGGTDDTLYVYNRLSHSVTVVDPAFPLGSPGSAVVGRFALQNDPTLPHVKAGRPFAYSSAFSAGDNASCVSCHLDVRTDLLAWNLSDGASVAAEGQGLEDALGPNAAVKGPMQTQTLQGLVNAEIDDDSVQDVFFSNRPYHWRGDRGFFEHFNGTFVNLFDTPTPFFVHPTDPLQNQGLPPEKMQLFRDFVFSVVYPPNPDQPRNRRYSGGMFDAANPPQNEAEEVAQINDPALGSRAQRGLKLFHTIVADGTGAPDSPIACVTCHSLPEGSNNRLTDLNVPFVGTQLEPQNIETAQMRGLQVKNKILLRPDGQGSFAAFPPNDPAVTGEFGLFHTGINSVGLPTDISASIFNFIFAGFGLTLQDTIDVALYTTEFDTGVGPMVGSTGTLDAPTYSANPGSFDAALANQELQVKAANVGLAVHARIAGDMHGFFYDVRDAATPYHEVPHSGVTPIGNLDSAGLLAYVDTSSPVGDPDNLLVFHFTPLGEERRAAFLDGGRPAPPGPSAPTNVQLEPWPTMDANEDIPRMTTFYQEAVGNVFEDGVNGFASFDLPNLPVVWYQVSLTLWAQNVTPAGFGVDALRHEAPRRFAVSGEGIEQGAVLRLIAPRTVDINTATAASPPTTVPDPAQTTVIEVPIYPVRENAELTWESAVELEAMHVLSFMNGGPHNVFAQLAIDQPRHVLLLRLGILDLMRPERWNWWWVEVWNDRTDPTTASAGGWQRITLR